MADRENISGDFLDKAMKTVRGELENKRIPRTQRAILESLDAVMLIMRDDHRLIAVDHEKVEALWETHKDNQRLSKKWEPRLWDLAKMAGMGVLGYIVGIKF